MATGDLSAVAVLVLGLLHEQPMHPYQAYQALVERGDTRLVRVNPGAVYHGFERLERDGLVEVVGTDREGGRPERTTYRVTDAGRAALTARLRSLLGDDHPPYPLFSVGLAEAHELPLDVVVAELRRRRERKATQRAALLSRFEAARGHGLPRRYALDVDRDLAIMSAELAWLDGLIADLEPDTLDWDAPFPLDYKARARAAGLISSSPEPKDIP